MAARTFRVNENNDLYLHDGANLFMDMDRDALVQCIGQATKKILGENPFNSTEGIDYFNTVFSPQPDYDQFRFQLMEAALSVPDVTEVISIEITRDGNTINYVMQVNSIYGPTTVSSSITG